MLTAAVRGLEWAVKGLAMAGAKPDLLNPAVSALCDVTLGDDTALSTLAASGIAGLFTPSSDLLSKSLGANITVTHHSLQEPVH